MYVVPTPLTGRATTSCIEDFFYKATKEMPYQGKTFDPTCMKDTATHFGKATFAYKVVEPSAETINFKKFKPLLKNLVAVIDEHSKKHPPAPAAP
jgi:hypothetical protein